MTSFSKQRALGCNWSQILNKWRRMLTKMLSAVSSSLTNNLLLILNTIDGHFKSERMENCCKFKTNWKCSWNRNRLNSIKFETKTRLRTVRSESWYVPLRQKSLRLSEKRLQLKRKTRWGKSSCIVLLSSKIWRRSWSSGLSWNTNNG